MQPRSQIFRALGRDLQTAIQINPRPTLWGTMVVVIELCKHCRVHLNNDAVWSRDRNHKCISVCGVLRRGCDDVSENGIAQSAGRDFFLRRTRAECLTSTRSPGLFRC